MIDLTKSHRRTVGHTDSRTVRRKDRVTTRDAVASKNSFEQSIKLMCFRITKVKMKISVDSSLRVTLDLSRSIEMSIKPRGGGGNSLNLKY